MAAPVLKGEPGRVSDDGYSRTSYTSGTDYDLTSNRWVSGLGHHSAVKGAGDIPPLFWSHRDGNRVVCER